MKRGAPGPTPDLFADAPPYSERERSKSIERLREGMATAEANAEAKFEGWQALAFSFVKAYGQTNRAFLAEDCRHWAEARGAPQPPSKRAWGPLMLKAERLGLVERAGMGRAADSNQAHVVRWRLKSGASA